MTRRALASKRIEKLRRDKEAGEIELRALTPGPVDSGPSEGVEERLRASRT
jgi:hypothetical protein